MRKRVLVLSPTTWDLDELSKPAYEPDYEFVFHDAGFYDRAVLSAGLTFDVLGSIRCAIDAGRAARVDGVVGTHDYPSSLQAAAVAEGLGLPGASVERALLCHHKYLWRKVVRRAVPDAAIAFGLIDPFNFCPATLPLPLPFFVKPVKGTLSLRAAVAHDLPTLRAILRFSPVERMTALSAMRPFNQLLGHYTAFDVHGNWFIAEEVLGGDWQVTVEGYVDQGSVEVMGIVDSVMYAGTRSFQRFEYPSRLPDAVQERMRAIAERIVQATGFRHGCFNVEMLYDAQRDVVSLIEMNPRMCTQFSDLYEKVDGTSGYAVQLALATGRSPAFRRREGRYAVAASFVSRTFEDRKVLRVPPAERVAEIRHRFPGTIVKFLCRAGQWLSQQPQDPTSYRYRIVNMGGANREELAAAFGEVTRSLPVQFAERPFNRFVPRTHVSLGSIRWRYS
jgi:hypothetical protein